MLPHITEKSLFSTPIACLESKAWRKRGSVSEPQPWAVRVHVVNKVAAGPLRTGPEGPGDPGSLELVLVTLAP